MRERKRINEKMIHIILGCLFIWMLVFIFSLSSQPAEESYKLTGSVVTVITNEPVTQADWDYRAEIIIFARKSAHAVIYFVLGCLLGGFLETSTWLKQKKERMKVIIFYMIIVLQAGLDEIHQLFVSGRGASISDVIIDIIGASIALGVLIVCGSLLSKRRYHDENCV